MEAALAPGSQLLKAINKVLLLSVNHSYRQTVEKLLSQTVLKFWPFRF